MYPGKYTIIISLPLLIFWLLYTYKYVITFSTLSQSEKYIQLSDELSHRYEFLTKNKLLHGSKLPSFSFNEDVLKEAKLTRDKQLQQPTQRENATLLMLVRNWELSGALRSMRSLEDRFNAQYHYDWIFMNDVPFTPEFIEATTSMASGNAYHMLIPTEDWDCPENIDSDFLKERIDIMSEAGILYGQSKSYRNMCHFNSGYFFRQEILNNYDYYFRVEPGVEYFCDFPYDPFQVMHSKNKKYGFVISLREYEQTIPTLWESVEEYIDIDDGETIDMSNNAYDFITGDDIVGNDRAIYVTSNDYNMCHFWTNFEIGDLNFFRSDAYLQFFNHLDAKGGFYYERWGDAPVHSIAASLLLNKDEIIHFDEIGYHHAPYFTCPTSYNLILNQRCLCDPASSQNIPLQTLSCLRRWWKYGSGKTFMNEI
ncbi:mannosyltransferase [Monosporozyma unispora]|nr:mannosyltransferase [Kazachstania unispora]